MKNNFFRIERSWSFLIFFLFFSCTSLFAQQAFWTWIHGTAGVAPGSWGTQGVPAATNEPPSMYKTDPCAMDSSGTFWFYGGEQQHNALWKYNPVTNQWTWVKGSSTPGQAPVFGTKGVPAAGNNPPYLGLGGIMWADAAGKIWLFGGQNNSYADMWKYDPVTNMWTWMHGPGAPAGAGNYGVKGVSSPANQPPSRYETCASWIDNNGKLWMFGGWAASGGQLNDLWKYDPVTNEWTWMKGSNAGGSAGNYGVKGVAAATNEPPARWSYCRWKDNAGNFWLFGGTHWSNTQSMNDLWKFDPTTNNWTWMSGTNVFDDQPAYPTKCVPSTTNYPQSRYENHVSWKDRCGNLWLFSGQWIPTLGVPNGSDIWCYKIATNEWVFVGGKTTVSHGTEGVPLGSNFPGDVFGAGAFEFNNNFYIFGGRGQGGGNLIWKYEPDSSCAQSYCTPIPPGPLANFNADSLIGCAPLTVYFTNTSTNSTSWTWNFGDGNTSNAQHPVHTYTAAGTYSVSLTASNGVTSNTLTYVNYVIVVAPAIASYSITPNDTVCLGQAVTIINTSTNATSYQWNSAFFKDTVTNLVYTFPLGSHPVYFFANNAFGCNDMDTLNIVVLNGYANTQSVSICSGNNYTLPGGGIVSSAGTYIDTLGSGGGPCDSIITTILTVTPPFNSIQTATICNGDSVLLPGGNYATVPGTYVDSLTSVSGCDSVITTNVSVGNSVTGSQTVTICSGNSFLLPGGQTVTVTGTYVDTVSSAGGCDSIITTNLTVNPNSVGSQNPVICAGSNFVLPGGATASVSGTYTDTLTAKNGCDSIVTTNLTVSPAPNASVSANVTITLGATTTLSASGGVSYLWSPSEALSSTTGSTVICEPVQSTVYCVTVTNSDGCTDSACVSVTVEIKCGEFYLPNAFSPNGDMENDIYKAYIHPVCVKEFELIIYNRWGEKLFVTKDVTQGWNGEFRGIMSNPGVYAYYCKAVFTNGKEILKEGNVSLLR